MAGALTGAIGVGSPASAAPVYEITGKWVNAPATIARGNPVVAEWRINVNDDQPAPSNDPVDNVTATFTVQKGVFDEIPDKCLTEGVDPPSSISADGTALTCNFGTVNQGTAIVVQTPVVANGITGEEVVLDGTSPSGETVELPPVPIRNSFGMDIQFGGTTNGYIWDDIQAPSYVDVDVQWSLRLGKGSDPGPDEVTYRLNVGSNTGSPVDVGEHYATDEMGCTPFNYGRADGHPWSELPGFPENQQTSFVDECILAEVSPGVFDLTLRGINYDLATAPSHDSSAANGTGNPLPPDWDYIASGSLYFRVTTNQAGSISLTSNAPTYTSPTGLTSTDLPGNNASNKSYTLPGFWSASWWRPYTESGGTPWDDTYRVSAGTRLLPHVNHYGNRIPGAETALYGECLPFDAQHVRYVEKPDDYFPYAQIRGLIYDPDGGEVSGAPLDNPPAMEYYVGNVGNPDQFDCGSDPGNWTTTEPADLSTVQALRIVYPRSLYAAEGIDGIQLNAHVRIRDNVPVGQDVWMFGSVLSGNGVWSGPESTYEVTPTPGARYPHTNGRRDIVRIVTAVPHLEKDATSSTVTPGVPAEFTLTYSANGAGIIPETVDGYMIRDTLPLGMTYVAGSAAPEPVPSTDAQGRQVLTWTLDDVATNTQHPLVYEAVADDGIAPGTQLTNTAVSSYGGESSAPVAETVTTTTNGHTVISKTADTPYVSNLDGSGDGEGSWTVTMRSFDPLPQAYTDVIDILPYEGDFRGTDYEGSYQLAEVSFPTGSSGTVYYATAPPATLSDDPAAPVNGGANTPSALWSTTRPANPTAVRVIGGVLAPGGVRQFRVHIETDGADPLDVYVNRAQGRAQHTELVMRTSEPMSVAHYYAAALKKYVQDVDGEWHDAQDVTDYPTFRYGDTVRYRIVVTNVGQGTITNLDISDDQQPALGNFRIDSLAPGEQDSHEFEFELDESTDGTVINTACGEADIPEDSQVPPTINCDPAGFEVANYTTKKTSDPVSGSAVAPGDKVTYTVTVTQQGSAAAQATFSDDLADVLDNATYNGDVKASSGTVSDQGGHITWNGTLPEGGVATITYSVTVKDKTGGDFDLLNVVTSPGCQVVAGQTPECTTTHVAGEFSYSKTSDPKSASAVQTGDTITYTVGVNQVGRGAVKGASITDDLSKVLDDATYNGDVKASAGAVSISGDRLTWTGDLAVGAKVTITYSVTVIDGGDDTLVNVVTGGKGGACVPAPDQNPDCTTTHDKDDSFDLVLAKRVVSGSQASVGDKVRYKLRVSNKGPDAAPGPIKLIDPLPKGLELVSAKGKGWKCKARKASDKVTCVRKQGLGADRKASPVFVVAKATRAAMGRVVNVAKVRVAGESVRSNNRDKASITVVPAQLPSTGFRLMPPWA